jgi:hypothetical protein
VIDYEIQARSEISRAAYRASSPDTDFFVDGPPVCITWKPRDMELFLGIAESEENFKEDPEFCRLKAAGALRIFDPFDIAAFEFENAEAVLFFAIGARAAVKACPICETEANAEMKESISGTAATAADDD